MSKFNVGDKVRYISKDHARKPEYYPEVGTVGTVKCIDESGKLWIQWPKGSTSENDYWCCYESDIELVVDENMTNEEIWEMLESKMRKNGLKKKMGALYCGNNLTNGYWVYTLNDAHNAIATAYRSGYLRAMKGRPFKFGSNKTGHSEPKKEKIGHWVPVDPNNLPEEGMRVRYSRECKEYLDYEPPVIKVGDTGYVNITKEGWFGIRVDKPRSPYSWLSFNEDAVASSLDMWVEDDE